MQVAVVGLGKMGGALARHLLARDVRVTVWNRSRPAVEALVAQGARDAGDLSAVWAGSSAVCTFLSDDAAATSVLLGGAGLLASGPKGGLLLEHSTISPDASARIAEEALQRGVRYLRCPVSGNPEVLAAGKLGVIVSGDAADVELARPVLEQIGESVSYVGEGERARVVKLAVNALLAGTAELLAELVVLSEAWDIERSVLLGVLERSALGSPFIGYKRHAVVTRDYAATFTLSMLLKDLRLVRSAAESSGVVMPVTGLVERLASDGCDDGLGELDLMALLPHVQAMAGRPPDVAVGAREQEP
ncbi:MAG: NAD(P)-dependent oxidoreductase [Actinomycetota bacterium]|nr:NAD(P)-dependent oxidoreductase [Actinomycetota bacterium]